MDSAKRNITILRHYQKVVAKYRKLQYKRSLTSAEYQEMYYAESKIEEEYSKPFAI